MKRYYLKEKTLARGKKDSIGIDVHKEIWHVTAISAGEELCPYYDGSKRKNVKNP